MISILSDFGLEDTYAAAMKAVLHSLAPSERILDLTHDIPPGDIARGALELWRIAPILPAGSIILAVVDPGVGTARKAIAFEGSNFKCVGPDNGLFSYLIDERALSTAVELSNPDYHSGLFSTTFHGRDVFAPAAAHLANGISLEEFGPRVDTLMRLPIPTLKVEGTEKILGEVLYTDRFGNLVTSIGKLFKDGSNLHLDPWVQRAKAITFQDVDPHILLPDGSRLIFTDTFDEVSEGSLTAYIGSAGLLEIAVNRGNASQLTGLERGRPIELIVQG